MSAENNVPTLSRKIQFLRAHSFKQITRAKNCRVGRISNIFAGSFGGVIEKTAFQFSGKLADGNYGNGKN